VYEGANARFRRVIADALAGKPIKIGILGGSVTKGHGIRDAENWTYLFLNAWKQLFPKSETTLVNGAVPATTSDYYSMCFGEHLDEDVDLIIVELLINDQRYVPWYIC
jgi:lysophospholipase L1-like esterase